MGDIDLHAHTTVSDGTLTPSELVRHAKAQGLVALAITDHDHVGALQEARKVAAPLGIDIITGVELSVGSDAGEFHLLGFLFDDTEPQLLARLAALRTDREQRAARIVGRLVDLGVPITLAHVEAQLPPGDPAARSIGRPHIARALMVAGHVDSIQEAFDKYLGNGQPAHVPKEKLSTTEALALIHRAGGVAVMAHPITVDETHRDALIASLAKAGLDGLEVNHAKHDPEARAHFARLAKQHGLIPTGGSDFHGANKPDVELGRGVNGNVRVTTEVLDALRRRKAERQAQHPPGQ